MSEKCVYCNTKTVHQGSCPFRSKDINQTLERQAIFLKGFDEAIIRDSSKPSSDNQTYLLGWRKGLKRSENFSIYDIDEYRRKKWERESLSME